MNWLQKTARDNYWRVCLWYDLDDLIQDGCMHWYRLVRKYPEADSRAHIMGLFKRTFHNHLHDLSKAKTRNKETLACDLAPLTGEDEDYVWESLALVDADDALIELLADAPEPLQKVLRILCSEAGANKMSRPYRLTASHRETLNERFCRWAGADSKKFDLVCMLHDYLVGRLKPSMSG